MIPEGEILARSTVSRSFVPGTKSCTARTSAQDDVTAVPFTATISSATCRPAIRAGDGALTELMMAPVGVPGVFHPSALKADTSAACFESLISR